MLSPEENVRVLTRLVDHFEQHVPHPCNLMQDELTARRVAQGTTGLRLPAARFDARLNLSQRKPAEVVNSVYLELEDGERHPYGNPLLAREFRLLEGNKLNDA